jgi:hypothetical protein
MSLIGATKPTYLDLARRLGSDNKVALIIEMLNDTNEILTDMVTLPCNDGDGHINTVRTGLPTPTWRLLNYGVQPTKSQTAQIRDTTGMLEAYAEVDKKLVKLNNNEAAWRVSEDRAHLEGMNQMMATTLIYGNEATYPQRFTGLAPRFAAYDSDEDHIGNNIIKAGGAGSDNTSIWLIVWGEGTAHGIYPKGSEAGFLHEDLGEVTLDDGQTPAGRYQGYRTHYEWDLGLSVRDWKYIVRIANIDVSDLAGATPPDLIRMMAFATEMVPSLSMGRPAFYMNKTVRSWLRNQIRTTGNVNLTFDSVAGKKVLAFDDVPVRRCDAILNTEATLA